MSKWSLPIWPAGLVLAFAAGMLLQLYSHFGSFPDWMRAQQFWLGGDGVFSVVISAATLIGVGAAAIQVTHSARDSAERRRIEERLERAQSMQRATELLASGAMVSQSAGIIALARMAEASPDEFADEACELLSAFVTQRSADDVQRIKTENLAGKVQQYPEVRAVSQAVRALARVPSTDRKSVLYPFFELMTFDGDDFSRFRFWNTVSRSTTFVGCNFRSALVQLYYSYDTKFRRCKMKNVSIKAKNLGKDQILFENCLLSGATILAERRSITLKQCYIQGAKITAGSVNAIDCWYLDKLPSIAVDDPSTSDIELSTVSDRGRAKEFLDALSFTPGDDFPIEKVTATQADYSGLK
ncbi:MAG: hypothetical protein EOP24_27775 [Hyphomicrobiales bacterium]|nr:MAG: hypothetical protein EOP24_27775 [Hyphomicrobiales bacterium]